MKAVGLYRYLAIDDPESLLDVELPQPTASGHDLLVRVSAIAVNPIDTKVRKPKEIVEATPRVLGWDAAGEVVAVGADCSLFQPGDQVYYSGDVTRPGCNAEYQLVDERIAGHMPPSLSFEQAAALPLTSVTAWESLFDRLGIALDPVLNRGRSILIIGAAGGVGSIAIQLAKQVAGLTVVATASRPDSIAWVSELGADHVVNHHALTAEMAAIGVPQVDYIFCCSHTDDYFLSMVELLKPQGKICVIVDAFKPLDMTLLKAKSATFVWESMFTRSMFKTPDMIQQHHILERVAELVEAGTLTTTLNEVVSPINAANLRAVHARIESGSTIGKIVLSGW
jgi:zinc-binding alcohol dehydrogenase family protein